MDVEKAEQVRISVAEFAGIDPARVDLETRISDIGLRRYNIELYAYVARKIGRIPELITDGFPASSRWLGSLQINAIWSKRARSLLDQRTPLAPDDTIASIIASFDARAYVESGYMTKRFTPFSRPEVLGWIAALTIGAALISAFLLLVSYFDTRILVGKGFLTVLRETWFLGPMFMTLLVVGSAHPGTIPLALDVLRRPRRPS